jgi:transmembrane sensor
MAEINYNLLGKILANEATTEENKQFAEWVKQSGENEKIFEAYRDFYDNSLITEHHLQHVIPEGKHEQVNKHNNNKNWSHYLAVAASIVIIMVFYFIFFTDQLSQPSEPKIVENTSVFKSNPKGQKSRILLPDGSTVWLNSSSNLEYYENFTDTLRKVRLTGEAYFEVVKDSSRLFVVEAGDLQVNVLGTTFNINNFTENEMATVSLVSGKIMIAHEHKQEVLLPGNQVKLNKLNHQFIKSSIDIEKIAAWKSGILIFEREDFYAVIAQLERWYDVKITLSGKPSSEWKFTGHFDNEYLKNVLEVLCYGKSINYKLEGKNVELIMQ